MMKKARALGISLLPVFIWILIQCVTVIAFMPVMVWIGKMLAFLGADTASFYAFLDRNATYGIYILMDVFVLIPAVLWFRHFPAREEKKEGGFFGISFRSVIFLLLAGMCLQLLSGLFLTLVFMVFPELGDSYSQIMKNLGMDRPTVLSLLYTVIAAPVAEETLFRGLTLRILEGAFPFWAANFFQALYFGIIHGNLVQGGYAFLAGMILGCLVKKKGTLAAGILCHFGVNFSGVLLGFL